MAQKRLVGRRERESSEDGCQQSCLPAAALLLFEKVIRKTRELHGNVIFSINVHTTPG